MTRACSSAQHCWRSGSAAVESLCCACREVSSDLASCECDCIVITVFTGDYDKQGHLRKSELWAACGTFRIKPQDITLLHCTELPDDPHNDWKVEVVSTLILNQIEALDVDLLITFDKDGISQHKNHQAIYYATASLCLSGLVPPTCRILTLETVNVLRKYLSVFDVLISLVLSTNWWVSLLVACLLAASDTFIHPFSLNQDNHQVERTKDCAIGHAAASLANGLVSVALHLLLALHAHQFIDWIECRVDWVWHSRVVS